ncbi:MAG: Rieske (2Fe-2S) protein [Chloroflexota bacterium]
MAKYQVATVDEIPVGERKILTVAGRSVGVFNLNGEYFALRNQCPHQGADLCAGYTTGFMISKMPGEYEYSRRGEILRCPWHGWEFDIKTGQSWIDPKKLRVRTYPVSVETVAEGAESADIHEHTHGTEVDAETGHVPGPYVAESYPVSVEQQLIFIEI